MKFYGVVKCVNMSFSEGSFVLYNASRINAILEKFKEEELLGKYPSLSDINNVDFGLLNQEVRDNLYLTSYKFSFCTPRQ